MFSIKDVFQRLNALTHPLCVLVKFYQTLLFTLRQLAATGTIAVMQPEPNRSDEQHKDC